MAFHIFICILHYLRVYYELTKFSSSQLAKLDKQKYQDMIDWRVNVLSCAVPFFISSSLLPVDFLYFKSVANLMHDVSNNTSPPQISYLFNYQHNIHSHSTRSSTRGNLFLQYSRLGKQNMSFSRNGVTI